ncbi:IS110 family transposase [Embleya sp. MST-111070]|uniref:IS110 family transposase n=1 Tax=Embleya sp. MST-111070 TaxID=3398231 RepID=UPI003F73BE41
MTKKVGPTYWAGIDWAKDTHDIAVVDRDGVVVAHATVEHSPAGVAAILDVLRSVRRQRRSIPIGIERADGLLVEALVKAGQPVVPINPTMAARYRKSLSNTRRKSDRGDSADLARIIQRDGHRLRPVPDNSDQVKAIAVLARAHRSAIRSRSFVEQQIGSHVAEYHPALVEIGRKFGFHHPRARIAMSLALTPSRARKLSRKRLATALAKGHPGRNAGNQAEYFQVLFAQEALHRPHAVSRAMGIRLESLLRTLDAACAEVDYLEQQTTTAYQAHPHAWIYSSFPGVGPIIGARLLGEIGDDLGRFRTARDLGTWAGVRPVTVSSGTSRRVFFRRQANNVLKSTLHLVTWIALTNSPGVRARYDERRALGDTNAAALRRIAVRYVNGLHHCLTHHTLYNEEAMWGPPPPEDDPPADGVE